MSENNNNTRIHSRLQPPLDQPAVNNNVRQNVARSAFTKIASSSAALIQQTNEARKALDQMRNNIQSDRQCYQEIQDLFKEISLLSSEMQQETQVSQQALQDIQKLKDELLTKKTTLPETHPHTNISANTLSEYSPDSQNLPQPDINMEENQEENKNEQELVIDDGMLETVNSIKNNLCNIMQNMEILDEKDAVWPADPDDVPKAPRLNDDDPVKRFEALKTLIKYVSETVQRILFQLPKMEERAEVLRREVIETEGSCIIFQIRVTPAGSQERAGNLKSPKSPRL